MSLPATGRVLRTEALAWPESKTAAGSKLARLAALTRAGLAVPSGFVITTAAMREHLDTALSPVRASTLLESLYCSAGQQPDASVARELRVAVQAQPIDPSLEAAVAQAYRELCDRKGETDAPVAVRSSACVEDGEERSFAGIFDTVLGVRGAENVLDAVKRCWTGTFSERALAYAGGAGGAGGTGGGRPALGMAVGVVDLVPARISGVAFSVHPVSGDPNRVVIEAAPGLGAVVAPGAREPERFELDKRDGRLLGADAAPGRRPVLTEPELAEIVSLLQVAETVFGHPVDVEWLADGNHRLWVVQARPVTAMTSRRPRSVGWDPTAFLPGV